MPGPGAGRPGGAAAGVGLCPAARAMAQREDLAAAKARALSQAAAQGRTLPAVLGAASTAKSDVQRQLAWNVLWEQYLAKYLTAEREDAYFQTHRRELDGTELPVSHVLLRAGWTAQPGGIEQLVRRAEEIRGEIVAGKLSLADAAKKYSAGPSGRDGGRLGWIGRRGPMDEAFSRAAFALTPGQISPPVRSPFGVHLIRCDEVKPGNKKLKDVRREVEDALGPGAAWRSSPGSSGSTRRSPTPPPGRTSSPARGSWRRRREQEMQNDSRLFTTKAQRHEGGRLLSRFSSFVSSCLCG